MFTIDYHLRNVLHAKEFQLVECHTIEHFALDKHLIGIRWSFTQVHLTALWRYMYHMYQLDAFTQSCPADQDIINHYKLQQVRWIFWFSCNNICNNFINYASDFFNNEFLMDFFPFVFHSLVSVSRSIKKIEMKKCNALVQKHKSKGDHKVPIKTNKCYVLTVTLG